MKTIVLGVSAVVTMLIIMYYRKQNTIKAQILLEEMKRPQLNVVPEDVTSQIVETLAELAKTFETKIEPDKRKYRLLMDSGERNTTLYPLTTDYQLQLPETIYGMEKISLEKAVFPMSLELINVNNKTLRVTVLWIRIPGSSEQTTVYNVSLVSGNFTITSLAVMLTEALDAAMVADLNQSTKATWSVVIDPNTLLVTIKILTLPILSGIGTLAQAIFTLDSSLNSYLLAVLGITGTNPTSTNSATAFLTGTEPANVAYPYNLLIFLDNKSMDFNSLRIMKSSEIDSRCFANFSMPSGNGVYAGGGIPSVGSVNGAAILVQGSSGASGLGTFAITKDMTNAYYKAYEGAIPTFRYINVKIRQVLPDGSVVTPDFNNGNHIMEFEIKARVDKISLTTTTP